MPTTFGDWVGTAVSFLMLGWFAVCIFEHFENETERLRKEREAALKKGTTYEPANIYGDFHFQRDEEIRSKYFDA